MTETLHQTAERSKQWSWRKRILTALGITGFILVSAFVIGSIWYGIGRGVGIFKTQNLVQAVKNEVMQNPQLVQQFYQTLQTPVCLNTVMGFGVTVEQPLKITEAPENIRCTEFTLNSLQGTPAYIKVQEYPKPMAETTAMYLSGMHSVQSDTFSHSQYPATIIRGYQGETPIVVVVLGPTGSSSWSLVYFPADPAGEKAAEKLAKTFRLNS